MPLYSPEEDSFLLANSLKKYLKKVKDRQIKILDIGAGSGIQAETCLKAGFKNVFASDINEESVKFAESRGISSVQSDLFSNIRCKFDLIIFNPPYLPEDKFDRQKDTSGGKKGDETIIKFLKQAKSHLAENGKILLLLSSLTSRERINKILTNWKVEKLAEEKLFCEKLEVLLISAK